MKKFTPFFVLAFTLFLPSCALINANSCYDANPINIPLHKDQNELKMSLGYGGSLGFSGDLSLAVRKHVSVKFGGNLNSQELTVRNLVGKENYTYNNRYGEGAIGYFRPFEGDIFNTWEVAAGYGNGLTDKKTGDNFYGKYHKPFLQVSVGQVSKTQEYGFGARYSVIHFSQLKQIYQYPSSGRLHLNNLTLPSFEWVVMGALGNEKIKASLQAGFAIPVSKQEAPIQGLPENIISYHSIIFQLGLRCNFNAVN